MRDSLVFYRSFADAIRCLDEKAQLEALWNIIDYGLDEKEPTEMDAAMAVYLMAKPQIDKNNSRYQNGSKGGRPQTNAKPNRNQTVTKPEPNVNVNDNVNDNVNVNVNVNDNDTANAVKEKGANAPKKKKHRYGEYQHVLLTDDERDKLMDEYGEPEAMNAIRYLDEYIEMKGYKAKSHYLAIRKWVFDAVDREKARSGTTQRSQLDDLLEQIRRDEADDG